MLTGRAGEPDVALDRLSAYRQPSILHPDGLWFDSWLKVQDAYLPAFRIDTIARYQADAVVDEEFGYNSIVWGTSSYLLDLPNGDKVFNFYNARLSNKTDFNSNPKWAILPRTK